MDMDFLASITIYNLNLSYIPIFTDLVRSATNINTIIYDTIYFRGEIPKNDKFYQHYISEFDMARASARAAKFFYTE